MAVTKRLVKGSALSHAELDGNFTDYETFKALFDSTKFTPSNNGKLLFWNNSTSNVEVKIATTSEVTEGTNLYYTDARFDSRLSSRTTDNLTEGTSNLYFTNSRADVRADARITAVVTKSFVNNLYVGDAAQNSFEIKTSSFNAVATKRYFGIVSSGNITATLPASPSAGDTVEFAVDYGSSTDDFLLAGNGSTIDGGAGPLNVGRPLQGIKSCIYDGTTWRTRE